MRIAVCDDQTEVLEQLKYMLEQMAFVKVVHVYSDTEVFFSMLDEEMYYDVVLMDIDWKSNRTGIDLAEEVYGRNSAVKIIYITAYTMEYVEDVFLRTPNLCGFLMKPIKEEYLENNLRKIQNAQKSEDGKLVIFSNGSRIVIPFRDILYMENRLHKVYIVLANREYWCYERLDVIKKRLNEKFISCHKSYVVNMEHIQEFRNTEIEMAHGRCIPVSKKRCKEARARFFAYLSDSI